MYSRPSLVGEPTLRWLVAKAPVAAVVALALVVSACGGGSEDARSKQAPTSTGVKKILAVSNTGTSVAVTTVSVQAISLKAERRVSRTVFEYDYQLTIKNNGAALSSVVIELVAVGTGSTVIDSRAEVAQLAANATVMLTDLVTIRHDRAQTFQMASLRWQVTAVEANPTAPGILLPGEPSASAVQAIPEVDAPRTPTELATTIGEGGSQYYLRQLQAVISASATVAQVNAALQAVGGRIVWAMERNRVVTIQVMNNGDLATLRALAAALESSPAFDSVSLYVLPETAALPPNVLPSQAVAASGPIRNQIAARVHAVWNANSVSIAGANLEIVVADFFGNGPISELSGPATGFLNLGPPPNQRVRDVREHGYHVLGALAANFGGPDSATASIGPVTGSLSRSLPINIIDMASYQGVFWEALRKRLGALVASKPDSRFIMNFSLQYCQQPTLGAPSAPRLCETADQVKRDAEAWRLWARGIYIPTKGAYFNWDNKVLTIAAAGNHYGAPAVTASPINAAALWPTILSKGDNTPVPPLTNSIIVEARAVISTADGPAAGCRADYSNVGGTVAGIGSNVFSFTSPTTTGEKNGTSMATPQVAGLAALMAAIRPTWALSDIKSRIEEVRFISDSCNTTPMLDAYAALLSLDESATDAPVRASLLRPVSPVSVGSSFSLSDAREFLKAFFPLVYGSTSRAGDLDFSRFDLNGDGYTGGLRRKPLNLNYSAASNVFSPDKLPRYPNGIAANLDESGVTDFEVLCYYINSELFSASEHAAFEAELKNVVSVHGSVNRSVSCVNNVKWLNFRQGDPEIPGDGKVASSGCPNFWFYGDPFDRNDNYGWGSCYLPQQPILPREYPDGITFTVFSVAPSTVVVNESWGPTWVTRLHVVIDAKARASERGRCVEGIDPSGFPYSVGGTLAFLQPYTNSTEINGVQGRSVSYGTADYANWASGMNSTMQYYAGLLGISCAPLTADDVRIIDVRPSFLIPTTAPQQNYLQSWVVQNSVDAIAIGMGVNVLPSPP